jgi:hypothetical protein
VSRSTVPGRVDDGLSGDPNEIVAAGGLEIVGGRPLGVLEDAHVNRDPEARGELVRDLAERCVGAVCIGRAEVDDHAPRGGESTPRGNCQRMLGSELRLQLLPLQRDERQILRESIV